MMPRLRKTLFAQEEMNMPPVIDRNKCIGCGVCADVCPLQVFRHEPKKDKIPEVRALMNAGTVTPVFLIAGQGD